MPRTPHPRRGRRSLATASVVALASLSMLLAGCTAPQQTTRDEGVDKTADVPVVSLDGKTVEEGGKLTFALSSDPDRLDPTTSSTLLSRIVLQPMCEKLYNLDTDGAMQPVLAAEQPEVSEDGLVVTIPVRQDAVFADGTPLNADAVVMSLQRHLSNPASARKAELGPITDITATDEFTVQITYSAPFSPLQTALVAGAGVVMSPKALTELGDNFGDSPVCVGPFKFVQRTAQTSITMEKDPNYYDADQIHLDSIEFVIMGDSTLRSTNLASNDVQVADSISTQDASRVESADETGLLNVASLGFQHINVNFANAGIGQPLAPLDTPIATDPRIRMALSMSIDRSKLVDSVFNGWYEATCSPIPEVSGLSSEASDACPDYDPEGAKKLLEEAGVDVPFAVDFNIPNFPDNVRVGQAIQAMAKEGGFDVTVVPEEYATLNTDSIAGNYVTEQQGWSGRLDPNGNMAAFLKTGGGLNRVGYSNAEVDELLADAVATSDVDERTEIYGQIMDIVHEENPMIFMYRIRNLTGYNTGVAGITATVDGIVDVSRAAYVG